MITVDSRLTFGNNKYFALSVFFMKKKTIEQ